MPYLPTTGIVAKQPHVNSGQVNHPLIVVGSKNCGSILTVLPVTSLNGMTIEEKYPPRTDGQEGSRTLMSRQYLAINHNGTTAAHEGTRLLCLRKGQSLAKQSYLNLGTFYEIEATYLEVWKGHVCLDDKSIRRLEDSFVEFLTEAPMRSSRRPKAPLSPFESRMPGALTPRALGSADDKPNR